MKYDILLIKKVQWTMGKEIEVRKNKPFKY